MGLRISLLGDDDFRSSCGIQIGVADGVGRCGGGGEKRWADRDIPYPRSLRKCLQRVLQALFRDQSHLGHRTGRRVDFKDYGGKASWKVWCGRVRGGNGATLECL